MDKKWVRSQNNCFYLCDNIKTNFNYQINSYEIYTEINGKDMLLGIYKVGEEFNDAIEKISNMINGFNHGHMIWLS